MYMTIYTISVHACSYLYVQRTCMMCTIIIWPCMHTCTVFAFSNSHTDYIIQYVVIYCTKDMHKFYIHIIMKCVHVLPKLLN